MLQKTNSAIEFDSASHGETQASVQKIISHFGTKRKAQEYALGLVGTAIDTREKKCIEKLLANIPEGASVLDLPCGNGRLLPLLKKRGYRVTAADSSIHMVEMAQQSVMGRGSNKGEMDQFQVANVMQTGFADDCFDAIICNRLFHHFSEAEIRQQALRELGRIGKGPIIVSFFCNRSYDALTFSLRNTIKRKQIHDRIPISPTVFAKDIQAAGLVVERWMPVRPFISKQWYVVLRRCQTPG